ncbi:MAG: MBOAT family protein [Oscillospiraceae bacterium]|nr:MBOAT family protein [Oscillospiraceae bacterium]
MSFTSSYFLLFLAVLAVLYYLPLRRLQWQLLLAASFFYYAFSGIINLAYISATIVTTFIATLIMDRLRTAEGRSKKQIKSRRRAVMLVCLAVNIGGLAVFKYAPLRFPLGISFYTLQTMGYLLDCYRAKNAEFTERNPFRLALFTSFFPQLIMGPISRFSDLKKTLYGGHRFNADSFLDGFLRIAFGMFKKLVIADRLSPVMKTNPALAVFLYAIVLYCDFTGGIDIALGVAKIFGIELAENFNAPFFSTSIADYWRRWHITMGAWFRDYIFYPLSISKPMRKLTMRLKEKAGDGAAKRIPVYIATIVTWFLTGIWHGSQWNYIVWGLANGVIIMLSQECESLYKRFRAKHERLTASKPYAAFAVIRTFVLMSLLRGFDLFSYPAQTAKLNAANIVIVAAGVLLLAAIGFWRHSHKDAKPSAAWRITAACALIAAVLVFGAYGLGYDASGFIYTQF